MPKQLGYPIFVGAEGGQCSYVVQDMVMHDGAQVIDWLQRIPLVLRIDIVTGAGSPAECIDEAKTAVKNAGFSNVQVRRGSEADYGRLGPPR